MAWTGFESPKSLLKARQSTRKCLIDHLPKRSSTGHPKARQSTRKCLIDHLPEGGQGWPPQGTPINPQMFDWSSARRGSLVTHARARLPKGLWGFFSITKIPQKTNPSNPMELLMSCPEGGKGDPRARGAPPAPSCSSRLPTGRGEQPLPYI